MVAETTATAVVVTTVEVWETILSFSLSNLLSPSFSSFLGGSSPKEISFTSKSSLASFLTLAFCNLPQEKGNTLHIHSLRCPKRFQNPLRFSYCLHFIEKGEDIQNKTFVFYEMFASSSFTTSFHSEVDFFGKVRF